MTDFYDDENDVLIEDASDDSVQETSDAAQTKDEEKSEYEDVCFVCRRPESKAGKMFKLPNNICVCNDCMHKTMETVSQFDYQGMLNDPSFQKDLDQLMKRGGMPNIRFVNISEPEKKITFNAALVKRMTGNDTLNARFLHENSFDFKPNFKIFINTNYKPSSRK